jgi:hypothetical protein
MTTLPTAGQRSSAVAAFLDKIKAKQSTSGGNGRGRLIFALDATASREATWDQACRIQGEMFEATAALGGLDLQLVYFNGYDTCRASHWLTTAADLHRVMRQVTCVAGVTQVERVLSHAIRETKTRKVSALVFVGDAQEEKLDRLGQLAGELGALSVPIFLFYETAAVPPALAAVYGPTYAAVLAQQSTEAEAAYQQLAKLSGGACLRFDLGSIDRLKELLGAVAVYASGGHAALEAYGKTKGGEVLRLTAQLRG